MMGEIFRYNLFVYTFFNIYCGNPILDYISIFVHNKFGSYVREFTFMLINGIFTYSGHLYFEVLSMSFSSDIVFVELLESCVFLRFHFQGNLVLP